MFRRLQPSKAFKGLVNPDLCDDIAEDRGLVESLILSGNGNRIKEVGKTELLRANEQLRLSSDTSLLEIALLYGDLDTIKCLVESEVTIPQDNESLKKYLKILFTEFGVSRRAESDLYSYNKSRDNLIKIYQYLQVHIAKNNSVWSSSDVLNGLLTVAANGKESSTLEALLMLNVINDVNVVDATGKTALFYMIASNADRSIIEDLKNRGAVLTAADELELKQIKFANDLMKAIDAGDRMAINNYLQALLQDNLVLSQSFFNDCFIKAIEKNDLETVKLMLKSKHARQIDLSRLDLDKSMDADVAFEIAGASAEVFTRAYGLKSFTQDITGFSHRIGVTGELEWNETGASKPFTINLEGARVPANCIYVLQQALSDYSEIDDTFKLFRDAARFESNIYTIADSDELASLLRYKRYLIEEVMILPATWSQHIVGVGVKYNKSTNKTYITLSNRGNEGLASCLTDNAKKMLSDVPQAGTVVYEFDGLFGQEFFSKFGSMYAFNTSSDFRDFINEYLGNAKPVAVLPAQKQSHGTCTYVNPKRTIEGLLLILAICRGESVEKMTMDNIYNKYKTFSIYDKEQACIGLIEYYKEYIARADVNVSKKNALGQFLVAVILEHHSAKNNEVELIFARKLYAALPEPLKTKVAFLVPEVAKDKTSMTQDSTLYSRTRSRVRDTKIIGKLEDRIFHADMIKKLLAFFHDSNIDGNMIEKITVEKNKLIIATGNSREIKYRMKDDVFVKQLGAEVENINGVFSFVVKNPAALRLDAVSDLSNVQFNTKRD